MSKDSLVITNGMPVNNWLPKGINKISSISNKHNRILGLDLEGGNVANYGRHWFPQCTDFLELPEDKLVSLISFYFFAKANKYDFIDDIVFYLLNQSI